MMGRTPDYLNYTFACFAARADVWARNGNERGAENLVAYQRRMRDEDLCDDAHARQSAGRPLACRRPSRPPARSRCTRSARRRRGSSCAAPGCSPRWRRSPTSSPSTRARTCGCRTRSYAICFAVPMGTPGLRFLCRDSLSLQRDPWDCAALVALRRDGRRRDLRRRGRALGPRLPRRRSAAPLGGDHGLPLAGAHRPPGDDEGLGEARVRVRPRPHDSPT